MHAATLFAVTAAPSPSGGQDAGAPTPDPAKPGSDSASGAVDAFTQALAAMMGVANGAAPQATPTTAAGGGQAVNAASVTVAPGQTFVLPANDLATTPQTVPGAADPKLALATDSAAPPAVKPPTPQAPAKTTPNAATLALGASSLSGKTTDAAAAAQPDPQPVVAPQIQLPTTSDAVPPPAAPALNLSADVEALALQPNATTPVKAAAAPAAAKGSAKTEDVSAVAETDSAASTDRPANVNPVPPNPADASGDGDRNTRSTSDDSTRSAAAQSQSNGDDSTTLNTFAPTVAPQAPIAAASLAAANGQAIVSQLADQVTKNVDGKSTRFDVALDPAGLGHVDVKVEINAQGQVSAQFSFDNAHAAAEAKSQSGQLQQALEQAGFNVGQGGLSFDVGGQGAGLAQQNTPQPQPAASTAPVADVASIASTIPVAASAPRPSSGVDIII